MILNIGTASKLSIDANYIIGVSGIINRDGDAYDFFVFTEHHSLCVRNTNMEKAMEDRASVVSAISV